jgi:antitoxin component YwqK of YwqJK toxin-antitoxin module
MELNNSDFNMEKISDIIDFSKIENEKFMSRCNASFFFHDPYWDVLFNPITLKKYNTKKLQSVFRDSRSTFENLISSRFPTKSQVDSSLDRLYSQKEKANNLYYFLIKNLKYFGLFIGLLFYYFIDFNLCIALVLFLLYLEFSIFLKLNVKNINNPIVHIYPISWIKNRNIYNFVSLLFFIGSIACLYFYINSIWVITSFIIFQHYCFVKPIVKYISSSEYRGTEIALKFEKQFENIENNDFVKCNYKKIKIKRIDRQFYFDKICKYEQLEELSIKYEKAEEELCSKFLFIYSKEPLKMLDIKKLIFSEIIYYNLNRLDIDDRVEFYFLPLPGKPKSSYLVIAKNDFMSIYNFEGSYSNCILKSYNNDNDILTDYIEYKFGIKHGKSIEYHKNGQKHFECIYEKGLLVPNSYEWYYEDGTLMMQGALRKVNYNYPDTKDLYLKNSEFRIGVWKFFDKDGSLIKSVDYQLCGKIETIEENSKKSNNLLWL